MGWSTKDTYDIGGSNAKPDPEQNVDWLWPLLFAYMPYLVGTFVLLGKAEGSKIILLSIIFPAVLGTIFKVIVRSTVVICVTSFFIALWYADNNIPVY